MKIMIKKFGEKYARFVSESREKKNFFFLQVVARTGQFKKVNIMQMSARLFRALSFLYPY